MNIHQQADLETALRQNPWCNSGLFSVPKVVSVPCGPSLGPETFVAVYTDEQWGDRFWYGHVIRVPYGSQYAAILFRSNKFINGSGEDILFQRVFHWTVVDPQIQAPAKCINSDCFGLFATYELAVLGLCKIVTEFDPKRQKISSQFYSLSVEEDCRVLQFYNSWADRYVEQEAFPIPPLDLCQTSQNAHRQS